MNRILISGISAMAVVLASAVADARSVPAYPLGHNIDVGLENCFTETYGGVQAILSPPSGCPFSTIRWEIGLPADTAGSKTATFGYSGDANSSCQLLAVDNSQSLAAWSIPFEFQGGSNLTSVPLTLNNGGLPAGGSLFLACSLYPGASVSVVNYNP